METLLSSFTSIKHFQIFAQRTVNPRQSSHFQQSRKNEAWLVLSSCRLFVELYQFHSHCTNTVCSEEYSRTGEPVEFILIILLFRNIHQKFDYAKNVGSFGSVGSRSVKVEFELEGTTASERVAMEGVTPVTLLCLRIQGIFAVVELLPHF